MVDLAPRYEEHFAGVHRSNAQMFVVQRAIELNELELDQGSYIRRAAGRVPAGTGSRPGAHLFVKIHAWLDFVPAESDGIDWHARTPSGYAETGVCDRVDQRSTKERSAVIYGCAQTEAGQVHYKRSGAGGSPVLVLFHESPLSSEIFAPAVEPLGESFDVIAFDTPGYGASDAPNGPLEIPEYAERLLAAIDSLRIDTFSVDGCHTGASNRRGGRSAVR